MTIYSAEAIVMNSSATPNGTGSVKQTSGFSSSRAFRIFERGPHELVKPDQTSREEMKNALEIHYVTARTFQSMCFEQAARAMHCCFPPNASSPLVPVMSVEFGNGVQLFLKYLV